MPYNDFSLDTVTSTLGVSVGPADLFPNLDPVPVPSWLREMLDREMRQILLSEKARSEFLVVPKLLASQEMSGGAIAIYSGQRLDVDPERGLIGECDFILSATPSVPALRAPLIIIVEAKRNEVESGVWQCIAQMVGAREFNRRAGCGPEIIYGCVTNAEAWQFLRLSDAIAGIDLRRFYIDNVSSILAVFQRIINNAEHPNTSQESVGGADTKRR